MVAPASVVAAQLPVFYQYEIPGSLQQASDIRWGTIGDAAQAELDSNLPEGVVGEKIFVAQLETEAQHSQEVLDEDDAFLGSAAPEVWEYEVVDARAREFEDAVRESGLVLEYDVIDDTPTAAGEVAAANLSEGGVYPPDGGNDATDVSAGGSGVRAGDDGPAGMPTGDPSAGGLNRQPPSKARQRASRTGVDDSGLGDLNVMKANDPRLGLTNRGKKPAEDWAADTGPTRNPDPDVGMDSSGTDRNRG